MFNCLNQLKAEIYIMYCVLEGSMSTRAVLNITILHQLYYFYILNYIFK